MKKYTGCGLAVVISVVLAGCGGKPSNAPSQPVAKPPTATAPAAQNPSDSTPPPPPAGAPVAATQAPAPANAEEVKVDLNAISMALQQYVAGNQLDPTKLTQADLENLVKAKYLPYLPPAPAGKKYVWNNMLNVTLADK